MAQARYPGRAPAARLIMYSQLAINSRFQQQQKKVWWLFLLLLSFFFFFFFWAVYGGCEKQVFSGWHWGNRSLPRIKDSGRFHLPLPTPAPPCPGTKVPAPISTLLVMPWASYPRGAGSHPGTWEFQGGLEGCGMCWQGRREGSSKWA